MKTMTKKQEKINKKRTELMDEFKKSVKRAGLMQRDAIELLATNSYSYYRNKNNETKNMVWCKLMMVYLFCEKNMDKKDFQKMMKMMSCKRSWLSKGLKKIK